MHCCFASLHRLIAVVCAFALAGGLVPLDVAQADDAAGAPAQRLSSSVEELLQAGPYAEGEALAVLRDEGAAFRSRSLEAADALAEAGFSVEDSWDFSGVEAASNASAEADAAVSTFTLGDDSAAAGEGAEAGSDAAPAEDARIVRVTKDGCDTAALLGELQGRGDVLAAAPNYVRPLIGAVEPDVPAMARPAEAAPVADEATGNGAPSAGGSSTLLPVEGTDVQSVNSSIPATDDPLLGLQWSLDNDIVSPGGIPADSDVGFAAVRAQAASGAKTIVAVLDDGVDSAHEDLSAALWENPGNLPGVPGSAGSHGYDFVAGDDDPQPEAGDEHGTHCAGIVAASSGNGTGVAGVSPNTEIMALRIGGADTGGSMNDAAVLASYEFLLHAKLAGQNVVAASNSWGGVTSPVTEYAINQAGRAGVLTVFSAGNDNTDSGSVSNGSVDYGLSTSPYVLSAAATSPQCVYASYTNHDAAIVDVAAPGSVVLSTVPTDTYQPAVAKLLDEQRGTPDVRSLYYHSMVGLEKSARIVLYGGDGERPEQGRLSTTTGVGLCGRPALAVSVDSLATDEGVQVLWRISNPFKGMTWDRASQACVSVLPGVAVSDGEDVNAAVSAYAWPLLVDEEGLDLLDEGQIAGASDNLKCVPARLADEEAFDRIRYEDTVLVGVQVELDLDEADAGTGTASFTLSDFGIGFPDGLGYDFFSGTSMACPLVAGAVALEASVHPDESALEWRGRIVGGTKPLHDAGSKKYDSYPGNWDEDGLAKRTASNGALDLPTASGDIAHPNTWSAGAADDGSVVLEGYRLNAARSLSIDGEPVDDALWEASADGSRLTVARKDLLDGGRHTVEVTDETATHRGVYAFPLVDKARPRSFERVADLPDPDVPDGAGFGSGILVAAADRLFCLDSKGRYLYSYDPAGADGWTECEAPRDAGFTVEDFRVDTAVTYADGKLYATVQYDQEASEEGNPGTLCAAVISYDIAADTWNDGRLNFLRGSSENIGAHFSSIALTSCAGEVYFTGGGGPGRNFLHYDPHTDEGGIVDLDDESDPDGLVRLLLSARSVPFGAVGDEARFLGYVPVEDSASGEARYALALGTYDGERFGVLGPDERAPRFGEDEMDALVAWTGQAAAFTGDSLVLTGASADGLGDTYRVDCATGAWEPLGVRAPGDGSAAVSTACFYRGTYYVLATDEDAEGRPTTALYRLPDEVPLAPNDHAASAQAAAGGTVAVAYDAVEQPAAAAAQAAADEARAEHVALGDTVRWAATPDAGYAFAGWYDDQGALVSEEASYEQPVTSDVALTARFAPTEGPGPGPLPSGGSTSDSSGADAAPEAKALASTGDSVGLLGVASVVAAAAAFALVGSSIRKRHSLRGIFS